MVMTMLLTSALAADHHYTLDARHASSAKEAEQQYQELIEDHAKQGKRLHITLLLSGHIGFDPGSIALPLASLRVTTDVYIFGPIRKHVRFSINELSVNPSSLIRIYSEINLR